MDDRDRDSSEGQEKSTVGDRNDGSEIGSPRGQTIPLSAHSTSTNPPTIATQLSLALQQILCFH